MGATGLDVEALVDEETAVPLTSTGGQTVAGFVLGMLNVQRNLHGIFFIGSSMIKPILSGEMI